MNVAAIVEDTADVRRMVRALLERAGATIGVEASTIEQVLHRLDRGAEGVVVLDHHLEGSISGFEGAALIRAHAPGVKIVLFTATDLADETVANPALDAFVRKDRVLDLPVVVRRLIDEGDRDTADRDAATRNDASVTSFRPLLTVGDDILATWLTTTSLLFSEFPPPLEAADVIDQLVSPTPSRTDTLLRFVAASGDVDNAVGHLLALRQIIEGDPAARAIIDGKVLDVLIVEVTSNVIGAARRAAMIDPLTGAGNRRALERDLASGLSRCERMRQVLTVISFDVVGLKRINDGEGHERGDAALKMLVHALEKAKRIGDGCYRVGGDEFVVVLPNASTEDATAFIERLTALGPPRFSWGATDTREGGYDGARLVRLADIRLISVRYGRHQSAPAAREVASRGTG